MREGRDWLHRQCQVFRWSHEGRLGAVSHQKQEEEENEVVAWIILVEELRPPAVEELQILSFHLHNLPLTQNTIHQQNALFTYSHFQIWSLTVRPLPTHNHPLPIEDNAVPRHKVLCIPHIYSLYCTYVYKQTDIYICASVMRILTSDDVNLDIFAALHNTQAVHQISLLFKTKKKKQNVNRYANTGKDRKKWNTESCRSPC